MKLSIAFRPRLFDSLKNYGAGDFSADLIAGITVGIVALPLAMAFGIASGVKPEAGILTAVVAGFLISALGGSRVAIGGPTGAFITIVYGIHEKFGMVNLAICTVMAGIILLVMGLTKMGTMIKYIPYPITMGFTSGIAVLIFSTQIKDFFGLTVEKVPADFVHKLVVLYRNFHPNWPTLLLACGSLAVIVLWPARVARRVPGSIVALLASTALVWGFSLPVETIGSRFGGIPRSLPKFQMLWTDWETLQTLIQPAFTIALLAAIESLLCCVVSDGMINDRHDSNQELMAQGLANIITPLFGGIPATGALARTATNVKNGARTPIAGIIHAFVLLGIVMLAAPLARFIPLATLSAVLIVVAWNMGEWHHFTRLTRWPKSDATVFLCAFTLTVLVDLTVAVEVGMILAGVLFIKRISETTQVLSSEDETEPGGVEDNLKGKTVPEGVLVYRVFGAFFFGAADKLEATLKRARQDPKVLILTMNKVMAIDATGLTALEHLQEQFTTKGKHLILSGPHTQPLLALEKAGFIEQLGDDNVCPNLDAALERAKVLLASPKGSGSPASGATSSD